jgi:medium-chain acyl-[acyl-carrier-protein] hydrolase
LPEPEFLEELRRLNGTPHEVLEHPELMSLLLSLLRADFELV